MNQTSTVPRILLAGEAALSVEFGNQIHPALNARVYALEAALLSLDLQGLGETIPSYRSLLIHFDPLLCDAEYLQQHILELLPELPDSPDQTHGKLVEIPTVYGGVDGPDLAFVAQHNHLSPEEVIAIHTLPEYPVYMMGFTPGFPYLGGMDARIATPRLANPREKVRAGSVGIAGNQTGIYSLNSPGGWRIIGRTLVKLFDPQQEQPFLFAPGDRIRFVPVESAGEDQ